MMSDFFQQQEFRAQEGRLESRAFFKLFKRRSRMKRIWALTSPSLRTYLPSSLTSESSVPPLQEPFLRSGLKRISDKSSESRSERPRPFARHSSQPWAPPMNLVLGCEKCIDVFPPSKCPPDVEVRRRRTTELVCKKGERDG